MSDTRAGRALRQWQADRQAGNYGSDRPAVQALVSRLKDLVNSRNREQLQILLEQMAATLSAELEEDGQIHNLNEFMRLLYNVVFFDLHQKVQREQWSNRRDLEMLQVGAEMFPQLRDYMPDLSVQKRISEVGRRQTLSLRKRSGSPEPRPFTPPAAKLVVVAAGGGPEGGGPAAKKKPRIQPQLDSKAIQNQNPTFILFQPSNDENFETIVNEVLRYIVPDAATPQDIRLVLEEARFWSSEFFRSLLRPCDFPTPVSIRNRYRRYRQHIMVPLVKLARLQRIPSEFNRDQLHVMTRDQWQQYLSLEYPQVAWMRLQRRPLQGKQDAALDTIELRFIGGGVPPPRPPR